MLTDLHLQKYLQGMLSKRDEAELEAILEKNPEMKARLEESEEPERSAGQTGLAAHPAGKRQPQRQPHPVHHLASRPADAHGGADGGAALVLQSGREFHLYHERRQRFGRGTPVRRRPAAGVTWMRATNPGTASPFPSAIRAAIMWPWRPCTDPARMRRSSWPSDAPDRAFDAKSPKPVFLPAAGSAVSARGHQRQTRLPDRQCSRLRKSLYFMTMRRFRTCPERASWNCLFSRGNERGGLEFQYQVFSAGR